MLHTPPLDFGPIAPELILVGVAIVVLLADAIFKDVSRAALLVLSLAGVAGAAAASLLLWNRTRAATVLGGTVIADRYSVVARLLILAVAAVALLLGSHYFGRVGETRGELYPLLLFATAGMTLITAAADLILMFLALEILSFALYVLTGFSFRLSANEAAVKYFLLGAFSSAFFLYGVALAYGATGTTHLLAGGDGHAGIVNVLQGKAGAPALALVAMGLLVVGFAFKVAAVPFHMWTPDVYQGAPTAVTAFMSAGTKIAAFAALIRVLDVGFQPLTWDWTPIVIVLAAITVVVGSILAIAQTDIKRLLAYSSIAHAGFILIGLSAPNQDGIQAALFYLLTYSAMILGAFGVVMLVSHRGEDRTSIGSYAGLARRSPLLAGLMTLFLLSAAGIPPAAGFIAKVTVFGAAVRAGHWPLVVVGVLASVIAAFFYLRVVVAMYMQEPEGETPLDRSPLPVATVVVAGALVLLFGVFPQVVLGVLGRAAVLRW